VPLLTALDTAVRPQTRVLTITEPHSGTNAHVILEAVPAKEQNVFTKGHQACDTNRSHEFDSMYDSKLNGINEFKGQEVNNGCAEESIPHWTMDKPIKQPSSSDLEELTPSSTVQPVITPQLLILTAKSEHSLAKWREDLAQWVSKTHVDVENLAHTLFSGRSHLPWRCSIMVTSQEDILPALTKSPFHAIKASNDLRLTYIFTGQGAQWSSMARELILVAPKFRESLLKSEKILWDLGASWSLIGELCSEVSTSRIHSSYIAQPATTAIQVALVDLLSWVGVQPAAVIGHSSGEIAAAYAAGALCHSTALGVSYHRGSISGACKELSDQKGAMLAVGLGEIEVCKHIDQLRAGIVSVACINSRESTTISGDESAIDELKAVLDRQGIFTRKLNVDIAYHSHHVERVAAKYLQALQTLDFGSSQPHLKMISSVTGAEKKFDFGPSYWVDNLTSTVRFSEAIAELCRIQQVGVPLTTDSMQIFMELGPHSALSGPTHQCLAQFSPQSSRYNYLPSLIRDHNSVYSMLNLCGKLFDLGYSVRLDVGAFSESYQRERKMIRDLPPYHWDHSVKYWHESRLSREHRFREYPCHDLLGVRVPGGTPLEPTWRHFLSVETLPWLCDHIVDNCIIFPGSGYICMAIEAIRQSIDEHQSGGAAHSFTLQDVVFSKALLIPEASGKIEAQLSLRCIKGTSSRFTSGWHDFRICSLSQQGTWNENCQGKIMVDFVTSADELGSSNDTKSDLTHASLVEQLRCHREQGSQQTDPLKLYHDLSLNGNHYGPSFAILKEIYLGGSQALGTVTIPDIPAYMPSGFMQPHIIHPATLDALFHINLPLFLRHCSQGSVMPLSIQEIVIPAAISNSAGDQLLVNAEIFPEGSRSAMTNVVAFSLDNHSTTTPLSLIHGELCAVGDKAVSDSCIGKDRDITYELKWGPDVDFITQHSLDLSHSIVGAPKGCVSPERKADMLDKAASLYIRDFLNQKPRSISDSHFAYLLQWMQRYAQSEIYRKYVNNMDDGNVAQILAPASQAGIEGETVHRVGQNLAPLLESAVDPLNLLLEGGLLYRLYSDDSSVRCYSHLAQYLKHLMFKNPHMKILEVGAGTGGATLAVLRALTQDKRSMFAQYDFTDISPGFFEPAKSLLEQWSAKVVFKILDIEQDPRSQGFSEESFDLLIAANVLHATKDIKDTIRNTRRLLKPGGRLALIETTRLRPAWNLVFGTLPGWWNGL